MKALYALLIILLLSLYKAETCLATTQPSKASECNSRTLETNQYKCCYLYVKVTAMSITSEDKKCLPVTQAEYDNIKEVISKSKEIAEKTGVKVDKIDIDCSSSYLYISLLALIIFLL